MKYYHYFTLCIFALSLHCGKPTSHIEADVVTEKRVRDEEYKRVIDLSKLCISDPQFVATYYQADKTVPTIALADSMLLTSCGNTYNSFLEGELCKYIIDEDTVLDTKTIFLRVKDYASCYLVSLWRGGNDNSWNVSISYRHDGSNPLALPIDCFDVEDHLSEYVNSLLPPKKEDNIMFVWTSFK
ncbi:MAG: hypothetical protein AB7H80_12690 [Candidatus Kapaibacterium sp.]